MSSSIAQTGVRPLWLVLVAGTLIAGPNSFDAAAQVTFNKDIAPLVFEHCAPCHHQGGIGPFPLLSYQDLHKHASQVVAVTGRRYMPPWPPEPGTATSPIAAD